MLIKKNDKSLYLLAQQASTLHKIEIAEKGEQDWKEKSKRAIIPPCHAVKETIKHKKQTDSHRVRSYLK